MPCKVIGSVATLDNFIAEEEPEYRSTTNKGGLSVLATMRMCDISFEQTEQIILIKDALNWLRRLNMI